MTKTPPPRANPTPSSPATPTVDARTLRIRTLNDGLRITFAGGAVVKSAGFAALPIDLQATIFGHIQRFDGFTPDNDPHAEHDFGRLVVAGVVVLFKIDYYDAALRGHADNPADAATTRRVLTVMLAEDY